MFERVCVCVRAVGEGELVGRSVEWNHGGIVTMDGGLEFVIGRRSSSSSIIRI